jgi:hypothetical protein
VATKTNLSASAIAQIYRVISTTTTFAMTGGVAAVRAALRENRISTITVLMALQ